VNSLFIFVLVLFTSWICYKAPKHRGEAPTLRVSLLAFLECIGMFVMFLVANVVVGMLLVLILRTFTGRFVSIYVLGDLLLVIFSAVQAFVFHYRWRRG